MTPERAYADLRRLLDTQNHGAVIEPLPMRRDPWASFRVMSLHELAACCVAVLAVVVSILA